MYEARTCYELKFTSRTKKAEVTVNEKDTNWNAARADIKLAINAMCKMKLQNYVPKIWSAFLYDWRIFSPEKKTIG